VATAAEPLADLAWRELRSTLDEELNRLPEKYRLPLVLCYLQGLTNEEAARRLGWPPGSMSYRLARGRELLRDRMLGRRRDAPAGFFAMALAVGAGAASLPRHLVEATVRAAAGLSGGGAAAAGALSGGARALADATLRGMTAARPKLRNTLALLLGAVALAVGVTVVLEVTDAPGIIGRALSEWLAGPGGGCHNP
jgi:hypothetical protein